MAVEFVQFIGTWFSYSPGPSSDFTADSGDTILVVGEDYFVNNATITFSGTGTYSTLDPPGNVNDNNNDTWALGINSSATAGSQTVSVVSGTDQIVGWAFEYSGVNSSDVVGNITLVATPGDGTGAILGVSQVVPVGGVLVALCVNINDSGDTLSSSISGTQRAAGNAAVSETYLLMEYAGTGAAIQPAFTTVDGADSFIVAQYLLPASSGIQLPWCNYVLP